MGLRGVICDVKEPYREEDKAFNFPEEERLWKNCARRRS
jgi:hypothetical protein